MNTYWLLFRKSLAAVLVGGILALPLGALAVETLPTIREVAPVKSIVAPTRIIIPKIGVNAEIEALGKNSRGVLMLPRTYHNVGWYQQSARPGKPGNALMWGHLNGATCASVFWNLKKLKVGDTLTIKDGNGNVMTFRVWKKQSYPYNQTPTNELFGPSRVSRLNLFTCDGVWNRATRNYSHRLIIFTELVK